MFVRLSRPIIAGLASLIAISGTGFAVKEVKDNEIRELKVEHKKEITKIQHELFKMNKKYEMQQKGIIRLQETINNQTIKIKALEAENKKKQEMIHRQQETIQKLKEDQRRHHPQISRGKARQGKKMIVEASAYVALCREGCTGVTATGINVRNRTKVNGYYIVAVDPDVIPLGSIVKLNGKYYTAQDTGGAINGYKIDVLVASEEEAYAFGRKRVEIEVFPPSDF